MIIKHTLLRLHHPYRSLRLILENTSKLFDLLPLAIRCSQRSRLHGIIPAHAELTHLRLSTSQATRDHPRACGAHNLYCLKCDISKGSSPRMRGSPTADRIHMVQLGIIPAHAGLTRVKRTTRQKRRDHPRACGAHMHGAPGSGKSMGSSPRMRGSQKGPVRAQQVHGIIPAHAGLTSLAKDDARRMGDHPRACGAHR